jgi:hypothetical protein
VRCPDLSLYPLCRYFLSGYLERREDPSNFPSDQLPTLFDRYETLFESTLRILGLSKEELKRKPEFNFDSGDAANLEGGVAILRVIEFLYLKKCLNIAVVKPKKRASGADLMCEKDGRRICLEVKAITKQSRGRSGLFLADQLFEKIRDNISKAGTQLKVSAEELQCSIKLFACVSNWFDQSVYLNEVDYQDVVNRLEQDSDQAYLDGMDGVLFITKVGQEFLFVNEQGKSVCLDS